MPILDVELVGAPAPAARRRLARRLADAAGAVFGTPAGRTWVKLRVVAPRDYAEQGGAPRGVRPVFVTVLKAKVPRGRALDREVAALTEAVARTCRRPAGNVHVLYRPPGRGRAAFGGRLVR